MFEGARVSVCGGGKPVSSFYDRSPSGEPGLEGQAVVCDADESVSSFRNRSSSREPRARPWHVIGGVYTAALEYQASCSGEIDDCKLTVLP